MDRSTLFVEHADHQEDRVPVWPPVGKHGSQLQIQSLVGGKQAVGHVISLPSHSFLLCKMSIIPSSRSHSCNRYLMSTYFVSSTGDKELI